MKDVLVVAEKELRDFLTGKRFLILMGIMLILVLIGILAGLQNYNQQLDQYKAQQEQNAQMFQQQQQQIDEMIARGESQEMIDSMQASLDMMRNQPMPSFLTFFYQFNMAFNFVGAILAIVMGFDLISGERESGSLRLLLTRPTYRDSVINGKALAGVTVITIILGASFLVTMAVLLMSQIVPSGDDLYRIITYFVVTLLFMGSIFAIALLASTFSRTSKTAVLFMLGVFVFMYILGGSISTISSVAMGAPPQYPQYPQSMMSSPMPMPIMDANGSIISMPPMPTISPEQQAAQDAYQEAQWKYQNDSVNYYSTQQQIRDIASLMSPMDSYSQLTGVILSKQKPYNQADMYGGDGMGWMVNQNKQNTLFDSLMYKWVYLIALLAIMIAAFGLSYMSFMRSDVA
ncbi:MAG TPA: ABC transporter permease subunit [Methanocella sp.]|jgi:ABC-2 type transport system permease protein